MRGIMKNCIPNTNLVTSYFNLFNFNIKLIFGPLYLDTKLMLVKTKLWISLG